MNQRYNNTASSTRKTSATDNLETQSSTTGRKLSCNARKVGLGGTVTPVLLSLSLLESCSRCHNGWAGDNCDVCGFGFNAESNCTKCIQNGLWTGTVDEKNLTVRLTFTGDSCSTVERGKFPNATHTMIAYY